MRRFLMLSIVFSITLVGCESKQAKIDKLQAPVQTTQYAIQQGLHSPRLSEQRVPTLISKARNPRFQRRRRKLHTIRSVLKKLQQVTLLSSRSKHSRNSNSSHDPFHLSIQHSASGGRAMKHLFLKIALIVLYYDPSWQPAPSFGSGVVFDPNPICPCRPADRTRGKIFSPIP